ncbi:MAG: 7-carboxy-7-deazaguanine synthase QueE [Pseudanabaenaceae cyanobacterium SKYGB_i_bin29]|nr:7-carboxy-7-deazaguanine synthase QueE [Pseudanabaenaceae cyanobacterium SKYG29]MDW8421865.1 7-carboxy-7-deazaguanine synthase QueE [Pseudanabaenaceae cyanobacterium SKYGB_i_bin29]
MSHAVTYPVVETFHSLQGEGYWAGVSAFFIRLGGCDVRCPFCDTKNSWNASRHPLVPIEALLQQALQAQPQIVVITGGEPLWHNLTPLTSLFRLHSLRLHLETSGAHPLTGEFDWITLSPKPFLPPVATIYEQADELKVVIQSAQDLEWAETEAQKVKPSTHLFLQPEWYQPDSRKLVIDYILTHPHWRLSLQTHKYLGIS